MVRGGGGGVGKPLKHKIRLDMKNLGPAPPLEPATHPRDSLSDRLDLPYHKNCDRFHHAKSGTSQLSAEYAE